MFLIPVLIGFLIGGGLAALIFGGGLPGPYAAVFVIAAAALAPLLLTGLVLSRDRPAPAGLRQRRPRGPSR